MIPHLVYYQLVILALLWLCLMLLYLWPSPPGGTPKTPPQPIRPQRKRSTEPKPFAGLTQKPHCALCEHEIGERAPAPPRRPDPIPPTHRRPRTVDTSRHFCPHTDCAYRGWLGRGHLRANGHPSGGPWRQCLRYGPLPCPQRTAAPGPWTPRGTFVPTPSVTIAGGWG